MRSRTDGAVSASARASGGPAPPPPQGGLATRAFWVTLERLVRHGGWLVIVVILAPILGPRDYGVFALSISGIAVVEALFIESAAAVLVDFDGLDDTHLSTAFVTIGIAGAVVSLLLYGIAGEIAAMFDDARLGDIFQSLSLLPLLGALTAVPVALLKRRRSYLPLAVATLFGVGAGGMVGVALATAGGGAWSLVAQVVTQRFVEITILWGGAGRLVGLAWSRRHFTELAAAVTGGVLTPSLTAFARQCPCFIIGFALGPTAAGLYTLAAGLLAALIDIFLVPMTVLARPGGGAALGPLLARASLVAFPAVLGGAAILGVAMPALLDPVWWQAVVPAQILVLAALPAIVAHARTAALLASGRPGAEAASRAVQAAAAAIATAIAAPYGLAVTCTALVAAAAAAAVASLWLLRHGRIAIAAALRDAAATPMLAAIVCGGAMLALQQWLDPALTPPLTLPLIAGALACLLALGPPPGFRPRPT